MQVGQSFFRKNVASRVQYKTMFVVAGTFYQRGAMWIRYSVAVERREGCASLYVSDGSGLFECPASQFRACTIPSM